jgi:hypothetical protein
MTVILALKIVYNEQINYKNIILIPVIYGIYLLAHFYSLILTVMLVLSLLLLCLIYKRKNHSIKILAISILTYLFTRLCYPKYFDLKSNNEHYDRFCENLFNVKAAIMLLIKKYCNIDITDFLFYKSVLIALFIIFLIVFAVKIVKNKSLLTEDSIDLRGKYILTGVLSISILWCMIVMYITPFKLIRYIFPVFSILSIILVLLCYRLNRVFLSCVIVLYFLCSFLPVIYKQELPFTGKIIYMTQTDSKIYDYKMFPEEEVKLIEELKNKNILENADNTLYNYKLKSEYPLVVVKKHWYYPPYYMQRMSDDAVIRFENKIPFNKKNFDYQKYYLFVLESDEPVVYKNYKNPIRILKRAKVVLFFVDEAN